MGVAVANRVSTFVRGRLSGRLGMKLRSRLRLTMPMMIAVGTFVAILPLLCAAVFAELTLQHLAQATSAVVEEGFASAAISVRLRNQTSNLERAIWQYQVLKAPSLLPIIKDHWRRADQSIGQLGTLHWNGKLKADTDQLRSRFDQAHAAWQSTHAGSSPQAAKIDPVESLQAVERSVEAVLRDSRAQITQRADRLHEQTRRTQRSIAWLGLALLLAVIGIGWLFARLISAPINRLMRAIAILKNSDYCTPIAIASPSEFTRVGKQLDRLRLRLARLQEDKDRFLRQVTHELKSPLASLCEGVELLAGEGLGTLGSAQREVVGIMHEAGCELEELIDNLLAYAEWRFEQRTARSEWFEARELLGEVLDAHQLPMKKRDVTTAINVDCERLLGRREQLRVALNNLVSNAVKHAPAHSVIEIGVKSDRGRFAVSVRDTGCGVRDADKQAVFEPFWRGAQDEEQGMRGTGVGLAIVMETLRAHGGNVLVEDAHPGARFTLDWPDLAA